MKSKIKSITVVCQQGTKCYEIGQEINGMIVDCIHDNSIEYPESIHTFYNGVDSNGNQIFRLEYVPVSIEYFKSNA